MTPLLAAAVRGNAEWCALVHEARGHRSVWGSSLWTTEGEPIPFYPNAVTLTPRADLPDRLPGLSIKDSFADRDLEPRGYQVLLEGLWLGRPAGPGTSAVALVEQPGDPVLRARGVRWWAAVDAGRPVGTVVTNPVPGALSFGNVTFKEEGPGWGGVVAALAARFPDQALVDWEAHPVPEAAFDLGFRVLGPLRVWTRTGP